VATLAGEVRVTRRGLAGSHGGRTNADRPLSYRARANALHRFREARRRAMRLFSIAVRRTSPVLLT
jgi:hypothetical protein